MTIGTRTVQDIIYTPAGDIWVGARVKHELLTKFAAGSDGIVPRKEWVEIANESGAVSSDLAVPPTGTFHYRTTWPDNRNFDYYLAAGDTVSIRDLVAMADLSSSESQIDLTTILADYATAASLASHVDAVEDAHAASAISSDDTTVQARLDAIQDAIDNFDAGAGDVSELTTATGTAGDMVRVAAGGGTEYRSPVEVRGDIGAEQAGAAAAAQAAAETTAANALNTHKTSSDHDSRYDARYDARYDGIGAADGAQTAAQAYADGLVAFANARNLKIWSGTIGSCIVSQTKTTLSATAVETGDAGFVRVLATLEWPDGSAGHLDGIEYGDDAGRLQYFTASHTDSGRVVIQHPLSDGMAAIEVIESPDYFVDSSAADGGDGSLLSPYNSIGDFTLSEDEIVLFASGSYFDEPLLLANGCQVYRYGAGAKPIFDAGRTAATGSWSLSGGYTHVYQQTVTIQLHTDTSHVNMTEDDLFLTRVANLATCESTPGSFCVSTDTGASIGADESVTLYVHPSDDGDPSSNGMAYRYSRWLYAIVGEDGTNGADNAIIDGVDTRLQVSNNGSLRVGKNSTLRHCIARDGHKHNVFVESNPVVLDVECRNANGTVNPGSMIVMNESDPSGTLAIFGELSCIQDIYNSEITAMVSHVNNTGSFGQLIMRRFVGSGLHIGLGGMRDCESALYERPNIVSCAYAVSCNSGLDEPDDQKIINGYLDCTGSTVGINFNNGTGSTKNLTVENSVIIGTGDTMAQGISYQDSGKCVVRNCTFVIDAQAGANRRGIQINDSLATLIAVGNKFNDNWQRQIWLSNYADYRGNSNCFGIGSTFYTVNTGNTDLAGWQAETGQDAASSEGGCV